MFGSFSQDQDFSSQAKCPLDFFCNNRCSSLIVCEVLKHFLNSAVGRNVQAQVLILGCNLQVMWRARW